MTGTCAHVSPQGLGLYAARDIEKHTMVIEYIGTIIRNEVANRKEKLYESQVRAAATLPVTVTAARPAGQGPSGRAQPSGRSFFPFGGGTCVAVTARQ